MKLLTDRTSPNIQNEEIPAEFLVLHYTACDLKKTLEIFLDSKTGVSSHFVVDVGGEIVDLGGFLSGPIRKAAHAGRSFIEADGQKFTSLNAISIGIEIVNLNGNVFDYSDAQYEALRELVAALQLRFPKLKNPSRIVGHEHIAGWRGKCDPGHRFDWNRFFAGLGMNALPVHQFRACDATDIHFVRQRMKTAGGAPADADFWTSLSSELEQRIAAKRAHEAPT